MARGGLQEVDEALVMRLHENALRLSDEARRQFTGDWRRGLGAAAQADVTIAALAISTRLMEVMTWLLTAQAVAAHEVRDPGPAVWRASAGPSVLPGRLGELAVAVDRLYGRIVAADAEVR